jgi:hypothetical protein
MALSESAAVILLSSVRFLLPSCSCSVRPWAGSGCSLVPVHCFGSARPFWHLLCMAAGPSTLP